MPVPDAELGGHARHEEGAGAPGFGSNVSAPHWVHVGAPWPDHVPATHFWHERWVVEALTLDAVPLEHGVHDDALPSAKVPTGHAWEMMSWLVWELTFWAGGSDALMRAASSWPSVGADWAPTILVLMTIWAMATGTGVMAASTARSTPSKRSGDLDDVNDDFRNEPTHTAHWTDKAERKRWLWDEEEEAKTMHSGRGSARLATCARDT